METKPLSASMAAMTAGVSVSTHHVNDPNHLPSRLVPPGLKPMDTTDDETYAGKTAAGREVSDDKRESGTDINGKTATSNVTWFYHTHLILGAVSSFPAVQEAVIRSREFQLNNSASTIHYFNAIEHKSLPSYCPTNQDILSCSRIETMFKVGELTCKMFDVSGKRSLYVDESIVCSLYLFTFLSPLMPI